MSKDKRGGLGWGGLSSSGLFLSKHHSRSDEIVHTCNKLYHSSNTNTLYRHIQLSFKTYSLVYVLYIAIQLGGAPFILGGPVHIRVLL